MFYQRCLATTSLSSFITRSGFSALTTAVPETQQLYKHENNHGQKNKGLSVLKTSQQSPDTIMLAPAAAQVPIVFGPTPPST